MRHAPLQFPAVSIPRTRPRALVAALAVALAPMAVAQDAGSQPPAGASQPETPASAIPGLGEQDFRIRPAPLIQEGSFLTRRPGIVVVLPSGERAFVFHPDPGGIALRPMVLIPSQALQRMERAAEDRTIGFLVTGEVFAYMGVNYLLPTTFSITAPDAPEIRPPAPQEPVEQPDVPEVEELIRQLELQRQRPRVVAPAAPPPRSATEPRPAPGPPASLVADPPQGITPPGAQDLLPDRHQIDRRRGRMIRLAGGEWAIAFDTGPQHEPGFDRPLVIVPCLNLQRMQMWAGRMGDAMTLEVSGRVLQYRGRNFLIPTLFRVYPLLSPLEPIQ